MESKNPIKENNASPQLISYQTLRKAIGILGILLPIILVVGSVVCGGCEEIQSSISSYYHTNMRNIFVGIICAIALFLFAYKGYDKTDNLAGDLACIFALGVAFFPTSVTEPLTQCMTDSSGTKIISNIHFISAALFFIVLAYFSIFLFTKGSKNPTKRKLKRNILYKVCGYIILASILLIALYSLVFKEMFPKLQNYDPVFLLETLALWAFGTSWLTKGEAIFNDLEIKK